MKKIKMILSLLLAMSFLVQMISCKSTPTTDNGNNNGSNNGTNEEETDVITYNTEDESGYDLWLRYDKISSSNYLKKAQKLISYVVTPDTSRGVIESAYKELQRALPGLYGTESIAVSAGIEGDGALLLGTAQDTLIGQIASANGLSVTAAEGYLIKKVTVEGKSATLVLGADDNGVLYGTFKLLELLTTQADISELNVSDAPKIKWRVLNQWDNWDGSIERGYSGTSIYDWNSLPKMLDTRIEDFARANASIGINTIVINNVNSSTNYIDSKYMRKVAAVGKVFARYGIKLSLSIPFDAPTRIGRLSTNDPLNKDVIKWWEDKTAEIYEAIPNFAGYLIKADSEGRDGPSNYGRTHAVGANMFADILEPYGGIIMWRAFVYGEAAKKLSDDICNQGYEFFKPLDGTFKDNVIIQCKNGPRDFLPCEPVSPLFGGMKETNMGAELQITQEYTGQNTDMCYLVSQWKYYLDFDMMLDDGADGVPTTFSQILQGNVYSQENTLIAGVSNVGNCESWNDTLLSQSNWYGFGRLAWNPDATEEEITEAWIKLTFNNDEKVVSTVSEILYSTWEIYQSYTSPYSMGMTVKVDGHYNPDLAYRNGNGTICVNSTGIGNNRNSTSTGNHTDATEQYSERLGALLDNIDTCPEQLICWFHHVPASRVMSNGKTLIENMYEGFETAPDKVKQMKESIKTLEGKIDSKRLSIIVKDFDEQYAHCVLWSKTMKSFFEKETKVEPPVDSADDETSYSSAYGSVTVDGIIGKDEWSDGADESLDLFLPTDAGAALVVNGEKTQSFGTVKYAAQNDEENLYILVEIIDDQIVTYKDYVNNNLSSVKETYRYDCLFLGFGNHNATDLGDDASVIVLFPYSDKADYNGYVTYDESAKAYVNGKVTKGAAEIANEAGTVVRRRGNYDPTKISYECTVSQVSVDETDAYKCIMEIAIPLDSFDITDGKLSFEMSYHDTKYDSGSVVVNSNRRENILGWCADGSSQNNGKGLGDTGNSCNIDQWGQIVLAKKAG